MAEKLPILGLLREALALLARQGHRLLPVGFISAILWGLASAAGSRVGPHPSSANAALLLVVLAAVGILTLPLVTAAHRLVLQGKRARTGWSLHREEGRYVLAALRMIGPALLGLVVVTGLAVGLYYAFRALGGQAAPGSPPFVLTAVLVGILLDVGMSLWLTRFLMIFPAAAIGESLSLRQASRLLSGNVWRLFLVFIPIYLAIWVASLAARSLGPALWLVSAAASGILTPVSMVIGAVVLSLAYQRLQRGQDGAPAAPQDDMPGHERTNP